MKHLSDLHADDSLSERIDELASKANEGELSANTKRWQEPKISPVGWHGLK